MMMKKMEIAAEISDVQRLISVAVKAANSNSIDGYGRCVDIVRFLKSLNLSSKDIVRHSRGIQLLNSPILRDHKNPKVRTEVNDLFDSWLKTLYSSPGNKAIHLNPTKKAADVVRVCSKLKKSKEGERSHALGTGETKRVDDCKSVARRPMKKPDDCKSFAAKPIQKKKKQSVLPRKLSVAHQAEEIKLEDAMLLFEIANISADVANLKGLLLGKEETSICVEALTLLIGYPISSTAKETTRIMEMLERLTKHIDRKICNSASALLYHWRQSIIDQERTQKDSHLKN